MSPIVPDFGDEPVCACGDDADDHVFTGGGFCNLCECERYTPFGTRPTTPGQSLRDVAREHGINPVGTDLDIETGKRVTPPGATS